MSERRAVARQRTFLKGVLAFNNGNSSEDCLVRDLTHQGAQIELPYPLAPSAFDFLVPGRDLRRRARVIWKNNGRFGLQFEAAETAPAPLKRGLSDDTGY